MPLQISKLTNLCTLPKFIVGKSNGLGIGNLVKLPRLQGQLSITGLYNVVNIQDAKRAMLKEKQGLGELALEWIDDFNSSRNEWHELQVLDCLQPHQSLKKLSITSYGGIEFSSWLGGYSFTEMEELQLCNCRKVTSLPALGKLPGLKHLSIKGMDRVKKVAGEDIPSLETLIFEDMIEWQKWSWSNGPFGEEVIGKFPKLRELRLVNCPKLIGKLPSCLPSLKKLQVEGCQEMVLINVPGQISLKTLNISRISGLVCLNKVLVPALVALKHLKIKACDELACLWQDGTECNDVEKQPNVLACLPSLEELVIHNCPKLLSFPEKAGLPFTLRTLDINDCESLESLPDGMMTMMDDNKNSIQSRLELLLINNCPSLKSFPIGKLPTSLVTLEIHDCKIQSLPSLHDLSHLTRLRIQGCPDLESFSDGGLALPNLRYLSVFECNKLKSLSIHMDKLTSLQFFSIARCCQLESISESGLPPNVDFLCVTGCENLRQPISEWGLCTLTSLTKLHIDFKCLRTGDVDNFPDDDTLLLPTGLTEILIYNHKNLKSISSSLQKFTCLEVLGVANCPRLQLLPKEGFPPTLEFLIIGACPLLAKGCLKEKGVYWPIVSHIPRVSIDGVNILQQ